MHYLRSSPKAIKSERRPGERTVSGSADGLNHFLVVLLDQSTPSFSFSAVYCQAKLPIKIAKLIVLM